MASSLSATSFGSDTVEQLLRTYAHTDFEKFNLFFRRMRTQYPDDCALGCLQYLAEANDVQVSRQMTLWLCSGVEYMAPVFDPELASWEGTKRVATALRDGDPQFFSKLSRFLQDPKTPKPNAVILRLLSVLPVLGDCSILLPWLRKMADQPDEAIRLQAAKVLFQIRPTRAIVDRLLQSAEPQTRADVLEALWREPNSESRTVFHYSLNYSDHRVVSNALVGLYLAGEESLSVEKMLQMAGHKSAMFRAAIVAAMAKVSDARCLPTVQRLASDPIPVVRKAAEAALRDWSPSK